MADKVERMTCLRVAIHTKGNMSFTEGHLKALSSGDREYPYDNEVMMMLEELAILSTILLNIPISVFHIPKVSSIHH